MAVQCILITGLKYVWEARLAKKVVTMYRMRAEILRKQDLANHINRIRVIKSSKKARMHLLCAVMTKKARDQCCIPNSQKFN